ncbi:hypothetical protein GYH30_051916 [Glycine max]|uniref:Reticulon domain-containing protein n=2 Tax=Glycine subgen. Soja TaxID=1462606 RepID=K7MWB0_SOYBN|nr:hypothetical protein GYH30_051916 [Glycine max]RZB46274.1 Reticulon-like protein B18 [Glycine soja]
MNDDERLNFSVTLLQPNTYAFVNGIEILFVPNNLYYISANEVGLILVIPSSTLETEAPQTASPRNPRKSRWRSELEIREEKDSTIVEEDEKPRTRRQTTRTKKEKPNSVPPSTPSPKSEEENGGDLDHVGQVVSDLIMWKDASKSTFWFGFCSLCLLSSCFTQGLNFSVLSALSQLGILLSGVSFFSNSICQRNEVEEKREIKLAEDDILCLAKLILPALNFAISRMRALFSGEPSMTLKVII